MNFYSVRLITLSVHYIIYYAINKAEDPIVYEQALPHVSNVSPRHLPASSVLQSRPEDSNVIYTPAVQHGTISFLHLLF